MTDSSPQARSWNRVHCELKKDPQIWELFTKKEEYNPIKLDKYGRSTYKTSRHKNVLTPTVSEHLIKKDSVLSIRTVKNLLFSYPTI